MIKDKFKALLNLLENKFYLLLFISVLSGVMHFNIFSLDLIGIHVWRQTETQTVVRNFYKEDFNILNPRVNDNADTDRVFRMEFPVMQWVFAGFYKVLGTENIAVSRILTFVLGLFSVLGMYSLLMTIFLNKRIAAIGAWAFNFSPVFYYYTVNPMPDNLALCASIWSLSFFIQWLNNKTNKNLIISVMFLYLATLAKLPFILFGGVMIGFLLGNVKKEGYFVLIRQWKNYLIYLLLLLPAFVWYLWVIPGWKGNGVVNGMMDAKQNTWELLDIFFFNIKSVLPELLINYLSVPFFVFALYFVVKQKKYRHSVFLSLLIPLLAVIFYFLFELNMIDKVHDYYMLPFLPFIFILVAYGANHWIENKNKFIQYFALTLLILSPITAFLRINQRWNEKKPGFNVVYYEEKDRLRSIVEPNDLCIVGKDPSHYILLYYLDRKGWAFHEESLSAAELQKRIQQGAKYLFSDVVVEKTAKTDSLLKEKVFEKGDLSVYKLQ